MLNHFKRGGGSLDKRVDPDHIGGTAVDEGFADGLLGFTTQASADDVDEIDAALLRAVYDDTQVERALRQGHVQAHYRLDDYASLLLALSGIDEPQQDTPKPGTSMQAEAPDPDTLLTATDRTATDLTATG